MVNKGESAPDFTVPRAGGTRYNDVESFTLSDALGEGPIVLAFFPAVFTSGCTKEMCTFRDSIAAFDDLDAQVFGISVDLPFAQNEWIQQHQLTFPLLSDCEHTVIRLYDVVYPDMYGLVEAAQRSVFVLDKTGTVTYKWIRDGDNPDFEEFVQTIHREVQKASQA